ncbi:hypothetical protein SEVIR_7G187900v4 [Setaria viridis]|uniref:Uncharacterized protein n=1 Tax=Setaria viridis TaxID=4556 RepID=A0A4U6U5X0_SETVI|nr:uncharacterized protein LOC117864420 [Setaria viridis]TKW05617.1 hypothetical protein SEVIR_7G187900v2 [Setaria viridis]
MERHSTSARLPAVLLAMLLLLATELATFGCCGHRIPRPDDVAAWRRHGRVPVAARTTATVREAASATAPAAARDAEAVLGESKRLVPQGSNPLHN